MLREDIEALTDNERKLLDHSFHPQRLHRRIRGAIFSAIAVLIAILGFAEYGLTVPWFAAVAIAVLIISAIEKIIYHRAMLQYESLINKLTHRIEQLEGVPLTPLDADVSQTARSQPGSKTAAGHT